MTDDVGVPEVEEDWLTALTAGEESLDHLRHIYPAKMALLPETGHQAISRAMTDIQSGLAQIHRAGRYVLGAERYESFVRDRVEQEPRGDQYV